MGNDVEEGGGWEALCRRCGECCFEKWVDGDGNIFPTGIACRFLDIVTRECKVYHKRFEVDEECVRLTPDVVEKVRWLPESCGYREFLRERGTPGESGVARAGRRRSDRGRRVRSGRRS